ncbi:MAG: PqiB family protein, partial [Candidatus Binatia bacterium]
NIDRDDLPQATVVRKKGTRISVVWIIPVLAAVVAAGIAIQRIMSEGPTINIVFKAAEGLEAGKTFIKYKDVNIGQVTAVKLSADYSKVEVTAKIDKSAAGLMVEDAKFWVVEPRVTLSGVSGLGTLLSGNYIGFEVGKSDKTQRHYTGLDVPPIITGGQAGRQFVLKASSLGSLGIGSPIYYHRLLAGQVVAYGLAADGKEIEIKIFVNAPYDKYVNPGTRFWNASGIDASIGAGGVEVRTQSLIAVLAGGLAFDTPSFAVKAEPAAANAVFTLYTNQAAALKQAESISARYVLYFNESLRGLSVGAPVTLLGLPAGEVTDVGFAIDPAMMNLRGRVEIVSYPERLIARLNANQAAVGKSFERSVQERHALLQRLVDQKGLRAQLRSGNLLTGQLFVALDFFPSAPKTKIDWSRDVPELPVVQSTVSDIEAKITAIVAKLDKLPLEEISADLTKVLATTDQTLKDANKAINRLDSDVTPGLKTTVDEIRRTIASADAVLKNTDATLVGKDAPAQQELRDALQEIARAARSLRILTDYLEQHPEALLRGKTEENP